ncbi:MAG: prepilin-type N-terminal cleavage/methylation domain-containing protein [Rhodocyclaceae bacterium]|nr:prepilin-type N-terminal cleavage/methylation domain-containing protein [Rhodocyclaceae bacterium]
MRRAQAGFTLVEIAVVLVIIGLLLGGVLKGQELINSAKVKSLINDFRSVSTMIYAYQDRFRAFPGDDARADQHVGPNSAASTPANDLGNGRIGGSWDSTTTTDESYRVWLHLRLANLTTGSVTVGDAAYPPLNAESGRIGVTGFAPLSTLAGSFFVCSSGINARFARQIDSSMDDGNTSTGNVQVETPGTPGTAIALDAASEAQSTTYVVCVGY